jgi:hypothetical protein
MYVYSVPGMEYTEAHNTTEGPNCTAVFAPIKYDKAARLKIAQIMQLFKISRKFASSPAPPDYAVFKHLTILPGMTVAPPHEMWLNTILTVCLYRVPHKVSGLGPNKKPFLIIAEIFLNVKNSNSKLQKKMNLKLNLNLKIKFFLFY